MDGLCTPYSMFCILNVNMNLEQDFSHEFCCCCFRSLYPENMWKLSRGTPQVYDYGMGRLMSKLQDSTPR